MDQSASQEVKGAGVELNGNVIPPYTSVEELQNSKPTVSFSSDVKEESMPSVVHQSNTDFDDYMAEGTPEHAIQEKFMTPHLSGLEKAVMKSNIEFEKLERQMKEDRENFRKERQSEHIPEAIKGSGQSIEDIIHHLEALIVYEDFDPSIEDQTKFKQTQMRDLDEASRVTILSYSIAAYVSTLNSEHVNALANRLTADVQLWLSGLLRCKDMSVYSHREEREGLVNICKYLLLDRYERFSEEGYEALYPRPPVLYMPAAAKQGLGTHVCCRLGLPLSCLKVVPCNTKIGSQEKMDVVILKDMVTEDIAAGRIPLLIFAYAGTPLCGHTDDLDVIQKLCVEHNIWLHVEGDNLSVLTLYQPPHSVLPAQSGNSITINLARWTGLPTVPYVTLYNEASDVPAALSAGLLSAEPLARLQALPLWVVLQHLAHEGFVNRVEKCTKLAKNLRTFVKDTPELSLIERRKKPEKKESNSSGLGDLLGRAISAIFSYEPYCPVVIFRFHDEIKTKTKSTILDKTPEGGREVAPYAAVSKESERLPEEEEVTDESSVTDEYYDALNVWLYERLKQKATRLRTESIDVDAEGICIRFAPLETAHNFGTTEEDVEIYTSELKSAISILNSTVEQRKTFRRLAEEDECIGLIDIPGWAGLGAVQYIPKGLRGMSPDQYSDLGWRELDAINMEMVHKMKAQDSAFSLGRSSYGHACVRFGLVSKGTDVDLLLRNVVEVGNEVEESSRYIEKVSDVVKKGIEEANRKLVQDQQNKLREQGVIRQVPIVGRMWNWFSPPPKDNSAGKAFDINSGKIETTETTYKFHMQVADSASNSRRSSYAPTPSSSVPTSPRAAESSQGSTPQPQSSGSDITASQTPLFSDTDQSPVQQ